MNEVKCDSCERILNDPTPVNDCYLHLHHIETPYGDGATMDVNIACPLLGQDKYFCGFKCLHNWLEG